MEKQHGGLIVDIGNVIIAYRLSGLTTENYHTYPFHTIPEEPGSFDFLNIYNQECGVYVTVVCKATDDAVGKNMQWLKDKKFVERTGIPLERIHRIGEE